MPKPEKTERNKEIYKKRKQGWSYGKLKEHYRLSRPYLFEIVQRETDREVGAVRIRG